MWLSGLAFPPLAFQHGSRRADFQIPCLGLRCGAAAGLVVGMLLLAYALGLEVDYVDCQGLRSSTVFHHFPTHAAALVYAVCLTHVACVAHAVGVAHTACLAQVVCLLYAAYVAHAAGVAHAARDRLALSLVLMLIPNIGSVEGD